MKDLAAFWEDINRTFPGSRMTFMMTETFGCGVYTPCIHTGVDTTLDLEPVDLGPLPRPRDEIEKVRAYALARHLIERCDQEQMQDLMQVIKRHEPDDFIQEVRAAWKNLSTIRQ